MSRSHFHLADFPLRCAGAMAAMLLLFTDARTAPPPGPPSPAHWPSLSNVATDGPRQFRSTHKGRFAGKEIKYQVCVCETLIAGPDGTPAASVFTTTMSAVRPKDPLQRPVIFIFNGGPGAASNSLLFGAFGPKRMVPFDSAAIADSNTPLVDNQFSPLDVADLVFIDPPDTGFSRRLPSTPPRLFMSIDGDSYAVGQVILHWLVSHGRLGSPKYLAGESYGSLRSVALLRDLASASPRVDMDGAILISQAITYNGPASLGVQRTPDPLRAAVRLADISAMAWFHGKIDNQTQSLQQAVERTDSFAKTRYIAALLTGNRLDAPQRHEIAAQLESLTGIKASYFLDHGLRADEYRQELLRSDGKALAQFDGRETEPLQGLPRDEDRDWEAVFKGLTDNMERYAASDLKVRGLAPYVSVVHDPYGYEEGWTYIVPPSPALDLVLSRVMKGNPRLRIMVPQGVFDTTSSMGSTKTLFSTMDVPAERVALTYYAGGHMVYSDADGLAKFSADVRTFISGKSPPGTFPTVTPRQR